MHSKADSNPYSSSFNTGNDSKAIAEFADWSISSRVEAELVGKGPIAAKRPILLLFFCIGVAGFKLWLVACDELVARANPLDQIRYLEMARELSRGRWLGDYGLLTLIREPGYPAWVAFVDLLGISLRLANEWLLLGASGLFCAALAVIGVSPAFVAGVYALLVLEPNSLLVNRDAMPAGFYLPVLLSGLAALILSASARRYRGMGVWGCVAGLVFGLLWVTRPEKALLLIPVGIWAIYDLLASRRLGEAWRPALARFALLLFAPFAAGAAVVGAVSIANFHHYGVMATTGVSGAGYLAANRALLSIEQAEPRRFVPVPRDVRERAYEASPAFRELRPVLEGPSWARGVSCRIDRVCDDIAAGYFRWLMREAAAEAGHLGSPSELDGFFASIAAELDAACRSGELDCASSTTSFLHPVAATYLPHLAHSARRVVSTALSSGDFRVWDSAADSPDESPRVRHLFDAVANRREHRTGNGRVLVRGRAVALEDPVVHTALTTMHQRVVSQAENAIASTAVGDTRAARGVTFAVEIDKRSRDFRLDGPMLEVERASGKLQEIPLLPAVHGPLDHDGVQLEVDAFEETGREDRRRRIARMVLWLVHPPLFVALTAAGLLAVVALARPRRRDRFCDPALGVIAILLGWVIARVALLVLVDASSFPARSSRYVYPFVSPYACAMLLLVEQGLRNLRAPRAPR
jgi:hypothetical protein